MFSSFFLSVYWYLREEKVSDLSSRINLIFKANNVTTRVAWMLPAKPRAVHVSKLRVL